MNDDPLLREARRHLDASLADLDGAARRRLARGRHRALESASGRASWLARLVSAAPRPALAGLTAAALAGLLLLPVLRPASPGRQLPALAADMDILSSEEALDFYQDMDFVTWLAQGAGGAG